MTDRRRLFLSKEEVQSMGVELTENTTDPIKVLYLPIDPINVSSSISFDYWSAASDTSYKKIYTGNGYDIRIVPENPDYVYVQLSSGTLSFFYYYRYNSGTPYKNQWHIIFNQFYFQQKVGTSTTRSGQSILPSYQNTGNPLCESSGNSLYLRIDITKLDLSQMVTTGITFNCTGEFFIKYKSGTIPADTIFYEPGTYE